MSSQPITPQERYATLVEILRSNPAVTQSKRKGFGSGLRINNKVFAMLVKGRLVVKLPQQRVDALIASGEGDYYEHHGPPMKEWVVVIPEFEEQWLSLAEEAMEFVASKS